jgi:hypothetical protein
MFERLCGLMAGRDDELPRRPRPRLTWDPAVGGFVDEPPAAPAGVYQGLEHARRSTRPVAPVSPEAAAAAAPAPDGQPLADELRALARDPETPTS